MFNSRCSDEVSGNTQKKGYFLQNQTILIWTLYALLHSFDVEYINEERHKISLYQVTFIILSEVTVEVDLSTKNGVCFE